MKNFHLSTSNFIVIAILLLGGIAALAWYSRQHAETVVYRDAREKLNHLQNLQEGIIKGTLENAEHHVRFLQAVPPVQGIADAVRNAEQSPSNDDQYQQWEARLKTTFVAYIRSNPMIAQIRYIGVANDGKELVRVDRKGGHIKVTPNQQLQSKGHRNYFKEGISLAPDKVYFSPINLNRELGMIEQPHWPTCRVIKASYDKQGRIFGLIVVNLNLQSVFDRLAASIPDTMSVFLLNSRDEFLFHPDSSRNFEFEFGDGSSWVQSYSDTENQVDGISYYLVENNTNSKEAYYGIKQSLFMPTGEGQRELTLITAQDLSVLRSEIRKPRLDLLFIAVAFFFVVVSVLILYWLIGKKSINEMALKAKIEAIFKGSRDLVIGLDAKGNVLSCNQSALVALGWSEQSCRNHSLVDLAYSEHDGSGLQGDRQRINDAYKIAWEGGDAHPITFRLNSPQQQKGEELEPLYGSIAFSPITIDGRRIREVTAIVRDISDAKRLQIKLEQAVATLSDKNREMEQFIYTVSHDLRSPLVSVNGFTKAVIRDMNKQLDPKNLHRLERVLTNVDHLGELLDDLLVLSRVVNAPLQCEACSVLTCLGKVQDSLAEMIEANQCILRAPEEDVTVYANEKLLVQCLQNLIENAIKYRHPDRQLVVQVTCKNLELCTQVWVADNGVGIEPQYHEKVFRIFERLEDVNKEQEGTGVGLSIVKTVMEKHQGSVALDSVLGAGATFKLEFPKEC